MSTWSVAFDDLTTSSRACRENFTVPGRPRSRPEGAGERRRCGSRSAAPGAARGEKLVSARTRRAAQAAAAARSGAPSAGWDADRTGSWSNGLPTTIDHHVVERAAGGLAESSSRWARIRVTAICPGEPVTAPACAGAAAGSPPPSRAVVQLKPARSPPRTRRNRRPQSRRRLVTRSGAGSATSARRPGHPRLPRPGAPLLAERRRATSRVSAVRATPCRCRWSGAAMRCRTSRGPRRGAVA